MTNEDKLIEVMDNIFVIRNYYLREANRYQALLVSLESLKVFAYNTSPEEFEQKINEEILKWETEKL